ncbi:MAG TPA: MFS transporter [Polyangiaceae bacterium]|nr:MFS transporter [Polyangiaceae bacterium]
MLDELWSGVAVSGAPSIEREFVLSHTAYVAFVFALPLLVAAVLEGGIALLSDLRGRRRLVAAGQAGLALSLAFTAWTHSAWGLALGLALAGTTSGVACGAAQALLVAQDPRGTDRAMVRWTFFGAVGDLLTPLVTAGAIALGFTYRGASLAVAGIVGAQCVGSLLAGGADPDRAPSPDDDPPADPLRAALARALRNPRLWAWLFAAASCTLLDELVVALATLRLQREEGVREALAVAASVTFAAGAVAGTLATDALVERFGGRRVLVVSAASCVLALGVGVEVHQAVASSIALFVIGVTCSPHHALAQARAYDELPANPGTVQAIAQLFTAVDIGAPLALGAIADRYGLRAAIGALALQPVIVATCALALGATAARRPGRSSKDPPTPSPGPGSTARSSR